MSQSGVYNDGVFPPFSVVETLTGNSGGAVGPNGANNINVIGSGGINIVGNPGTFTLTVSGDGTIATSYPTNSGTGIPAAGVLNVLGGSAANPGRDVITSATGNNVYVGLKNAITLGDLADISLNNAITIESGDIALTNATGPLDDAFVQKFKILGVGGGYNEIGFLFNNINIGYNACLAYPTMDTTSEFNIGIGAVSLSNLTFGRANIGIGQGALQKVTTGSNNHGQGYTSLQNLTTGSGNCAYGVSSLVNLVTGSNNIAIGYLAGASGAVNSSESSNIWLNNTGTAGESNTLRIGASTGAGASQLNRAFIYGINGVTIGANTRVITIDSSTSQLGVLPAATNGQVIIGATGLTPAWATLTAGTGISIANAANSITINGTGGGISWSVIAANQTAAVNNGYFCNKAGTLTLALPAVSAVGDIIEVANINTATGTQFTQAAGQQIYIASSNTTLGAGGTLTSSAVGDTLKLVCRTANTIWQVISLVGNWTPV